MQFPHYADVVLEVVRTLILQVPHDERFRWVRVEVNKRLHDPRGRCYHPFLVRMYIQSGEECGSWEEPEGYPFSGADSADAALARFLEEALPNHAPIAYGIESNN